MWFGHGTGPGKDAKAGDDGDDLFGPAAIDARIAAVAQGAIGALPADLRARAAARNDPATLERLTAVMAAWAHAATLDHAAFAERFLGRAADDPVAGDLRAAAMGAATAKSHADLAETAGHLADAMQAIGIDHWQSFVADAEGRANDPATRAAVTDSRQPRDADTPPVRAGNPAGVMAYAKPPSLSELMKRDDSIRPVYPVETALGIAAAGGVAAAARAVGGAIVRQVLPEKAPTPSVQPRMQSLDEPTDAPNGSPKDASPLVQGPSSQAKVSPARRIHILDSDGTGGGHRFGTGISGKSEFPANWSDNKTISEIESVANDPASTRTVQENGRTVADGTRDGVDIRVVLNPDGSIRAAHPTNTPINP